MRIFSSTFPPIRKILSGFKSHTWISRGKQYKNKGKVLVFRTRHLRVNFYQMIHKSFKSFGRQRVSWFSHKQSLFVDIFLTLLWLNKASTWIFLFLDPSFMKRYSVPQRLVYVYISMLAIRCRYYFAWMLGKSAFFHLFYSLRYS